MKKIFVLLAIFSLLTVNAFAHGGNDLILHGYIIDNMCVGMHKNDLKEFTKTHEKTCLLKTACANSGYSIYTEDDGQLYKLDAASNGIVTNFLKNPENRTDVVVIAEKNGDALSIESITNRRIVRY